MRIIVKLLVVVSLFVSIYGLAFSQFSIEEQNRLMYLTTPNENHELLAKLSGRWKQNYQYTKGESLEYGKGFSENKMIFGNRFIEILNNIDYFGTVTSTMQIIGFDNYAQQYTIYSIDEVGTDSKFAFGNYYPDKKQLIFEKQVDVLNPEKAAFKIIISFERENKFTYEFYLKDKEKYRRVLLIQNIKQE